MFSNRTRYNPSNFAATMQRLKSLSDTKILNSRKNEYIAYSQSLKKIYQLQDIDLLLNQMLDNQLFPNTVIINQLIKKLSQVGFEYVYNLYRITVNKGIADTITYNSTIDAIAKGKNPNAEAAIRLLEEAKQAGFADQYTYASTIDAIAKSKNPNAEAAIRLLEEAKQAGFANEYIYASTIDVIAKSANPNAHEAIRLLEEAKQTGFVDAITYNRTIGTIAKSVNPNAEAAIKLLEEAKQAGFANKYIYANTIDAIAKSPKPNADVAIKLLEEAKTLGFANVITYNSTIDVIAKSANPNVHDAIRLLEEAKQAGIADTYTYTNTIDVIAKSVNPNAQYAIKLLKEAKKNGLLELPTITSGDVVDLHGLSFGSAYFWLKKEMEELLLNSTDTVSITFIYGKGLNSRTNEETHPMKHVVLKMVQDMKNNISYCNEIEDNTGRFHINFQRKKLQDEWHKQADYHDITLKKIDKNQHVQRLFAQHAGYQTRHSEIISDLNPNANEFIPQIRN